ncbi:winged helix-turn-helix domain-containing protein [Actinomycetota bacterium]
MSRPTTNSDQPQIEIDRLIHEPARLIIMAHLYVVDEADFVYLAQQTGLTHGNINTHMARLEAGRYVDIEKMFVANRPRTVYRITEEGRMALRRYRQQVGNLLAAVDNPAPNETRVDG